MDVRGAGDGDPWAVTDLVHAAVRGCQFHGDVSRCCVHVVDTGFVDVSRFVAWVLSVQRVPVTKVPVVLAWDGFHSDGVAQDRVVNVLDG